MWKFHISTRGMLLMIRFVHSNLIRVENGRENILTILVSVFFCREREQEWNRRTGKRRRYYGISGTEHIGREYVDYDRETVTQIGKTHVTTRKI